MKHSSSSPGRRVSDSIGLKAVAGLGPAMCMGQLSPSPIAPPPPTRSNIIQITYPVPGLRFKNYMQLWLGIKRYLIFVFPLSLLCNNNQTWNQWARDKPWAGQFQVSPQDTTPSPISFWGIELGSCLSFPLAALWALLQ